MAQTTKLEQPAGPITILNVGTKILMRDAMDQYLRTLGDVRTYYASNMKNALRSMEEHSIHVLICEVFLEDGSAERLLKQLGPRSIQDELWLVLALEEKREDYVALALELGANAVLIKPFAATDLKNQIERYKNRNQNSLPDKGVELIKEAEAAMRERRTFDADKKYKEAAIAAPQNHIVQYYSGQYLLGKHEYGLAEKCFKKALELKPGFVPALYSLGQVEFNRGNFDKSFDYLKEASRISPLLMERALLLARCNNMKAAETLMKVLKDDEYHPLARLELGKILIQKKDYVAGLQHLERVMPLLTDEPQKECHTYMALARKLGSISRE